MWEFIDPLGERGDFFKHYCIKIIDLKDLSLFRRSSEREYLIVSLFCTIGAVNIFFNL